MLNDRKAALVGCGFVGYAFAFAFMESVLFTEMVLVRRIVEAISRNEKTILPVFYL